MDLSVYISELLNERGTINIPGIGAFKQVRKRGYYNADEGKLYPPYFATDFEQQAVTDDTLLQYLIEKSKVSASSAKFFLDRYVQNILQQAEIGEAMIGSLGWLSKEVDTITFRPANNVSATSAAFGFAPVSVGSGEVLETEEKVAETVAPVIEPVATPAPQEPANAAPSTNNEQEQLATETKPEEQPATATAPATNNPQEHPAPATATATQTASTETPTFSIEKELAKPAGPAPQQPVEAPQQPRPNISPLIRQPKPVQPKPAVSEPVAAVAPIPEPVIIKAAEPVEAYTESTERPFYLRIPFYLGVAFVIVAAGIIFLLKNTDNGPKGKPADKATPSMDSVVVKTPAPADTVVIKAPAPKDTAFKLNTLPESTEYAPEVETPPAATTHPIVNSNNYKYVLIGGSYGTYDEALAACNRYKKVGISATPFENVRKLYKVALGYYKTYGEGQQAKQDFVKQGKVLSWKLYVETLRK